MYFISYITETYPRPQNTINLYARVVRYFIKSAMWQQNKDIRKKNGKEAANDEQRCSRNETNYRKWKYSKIHQIKQDNLC